MLRGAPPLKPPFASLLIEKDNPAPANHCQASSPSKVSERVVYNQTPRLRAGNWAQNDNPPVVYTRGMTDSGRFMRKSRKKPHDETLAEAVARGKRERQAVLKRVRKQRALILRRLTAKSGSA
jgi:hypothetical protein